MTRTGYAKPTGVSTPSRPLQPPPDTWMIPGIHHPLPGFGRLQGFSQIPTPAGNRRRLLRFRPFQRHHRPTCRTRCPTVPLIAHRFSQPPGDPDVRNDLRVCSTPLALLGSWPPESDPRSIGNCFQSSLLLRCYPPFTAFFQTTLTSARHPTITVLPEHGLCTIRPLVPQAGPVSIMGLGQP
jgi:hypothetical protein